MPIYFCRVIDRKGKSSEFKREAISEEILIRELNQENIFPVMVREIQESTITKAKRKRYSSASILEFTNTISLLLSSGLTFKDSLEIAQTIFLKGQVNEIIVALLEEIRKGRSVYQVLDDFGTGFPPIFKGFIKIGEKIGSLEGAFKKLAEYLTEDRKLKSKLASSLIYPVLVISVAVIGIIGIVVFILPKIGEMFSQLGVGLPRRLESMIKILNYSFIIGTILTGIVILSILILSIIRKRNKGMAEKLDRLSLKLPVLGRMRYLKEILNFLFAMETLTGGGFNVEDALLESGKVVENQAFRSGILKARDSIIKGESLSVSFLSNPIFSERLGRWMAIGERSGSVDKIFAQLRSYYQGEIEKWSTRFMSLVEPILILIVGIIIFMIIVFFITPIFSIYEGLI
ncbi:MAG TPA: type II secretion system F family protein [Spirochaetales bacterium]|nr:type II secretion system F family protein [Spirochaetales bacterium]